MAADGASSPDRGAAAAKFVQLSGDSGYPAAFAAVHDTVAHGLAYKQNYQTAEASCLQKHDSRTWCTPQTQQMQNNSAAQLCNILLSPFHARGVNSINQNAARGKVCSVCAIRLLLQAASSPACDLDQHATLPVITRHEWQQSSKLASW